MIDRECEDWISEDWIQRKLADYRSTDDVFRDTFLTGVIFTGVGTKFSISREANDFLESKGTNWIEISDAETVDVNLPSGCYLTSGQQLLEIFALHDDVQGAFMAALISGTEL